MTLTAVVHLKEGLTEVREGDILTCVDSGNWHKEFPGVLGGDYMIWWRDRAWRFEALGFKCPAEKDYGADWRRFVLKSRTEPPPLEDML